jgi:two-component system chemotaxis response regulator CheY
MENSKALVMKLFGKKVMIVDNDPFDRFVLREILEKFTSAEIVEYNSGVEALENITNISQSKQKLADLIFLNVEMPVLDGFGFLNALEQLRGEYKTYCRIIFITSCMNKAERKKALTHSNVIGYFEKPIREEELLELQKQFRYKRAS